MNTGISINNRAKEIYKFIFTLQARIVDLYLSRQYLQKWVQIVIYYEFFFVVNYQTNFAFKNNAGVSH